MNFITIVLIVIVFALVVLLTIAVTHFINKDD